MTDAPACGFDHVYITVDRVRVHQTSTANDNDAGWSEVVLNPTQRIDLLGLTNGVLAELGQTPLAAGQYTQVRLLLRPNGSGALANSVVPTGGVETALDTPSATQSGLKLIHGFTVQPNMLTDLVLDFDACRSVVRKGNGGFNLKPVIAVIPRTTTAIIGTVDPALIGVTVSVQKNGTVVRSTTPNANGDFVLSGLDPAQSPFDVVFTATSVATSVVTATPVTAGASTRISTTAAPITLPTATTGVANGKVLPIAASPAFVRYKRLAAFRRLKSRTTTPMRRRQLLVHVANHGTAPCDVFDDSASDIQFAGRKCNQLHARGFRDRICHAVEGSDDRRGAGRQRFHAGRGALNESRSRWSVVSAGYRKAFPPRCFRFRLRTDAQHRLGQIEYLRPQNSHVTLTDPCSAMIESTSSWPSDISIFAMRSREQVH